MNPTNMDWVWYSVQVKKRKEKSDSSCHVEEEKENLMVRFAIFCLKHAKAL